MTVHRLHAAQLIRRPIDVVFAFFADPRNLPRITPPAFEVRWHDFEMRAGLVIGYRIRPLPELPVGCARGLASCRSAHPAGS